jgi:hypothetical protein
MRHDRPTVTLSVPMPDDVLKDLTEVARERSVPDVPTLVRSYIADGLRKDSMEIRAWKQIAAAREAGGRPLVGPGEPVSERMYLRRRYGCTGSTTMRLSG